MQLCEEEARGHNFKDEDTGLSHVGHGLRAGEWRQTGPALWPPAQGTQGAQETQPRFYPRNLPLFGGWLEGEQGEAWVSYEELCRSAIQATKLNKPLAHSLFSFSPSEALCLQTNLVLTAVTVPTSPWRPEPLNPLLVMTTQGLS